jgi:hypothetical protein
VEAAEKEEVQQEPVEDAPVEEQEVSPEEALREALKKKSKVEELEAQVATERDNIQAELDDLHHRLATNLVDTLMTEKLPAFASEFTENTVFKLYGDIQAHIEKIKQHDEAFPKTVAGGKYSVDMEREEYLFWLNCLEKYIATGESLERFLRGVFGTRTVGTPFSTE